MWKVEECFCRFQNVMPRNILGSWARLPHGWAFQNGWTVAQENIPWSRGHWKFQPGDGANPLTPCSTILFNHTVLPVWQFQRMKQETSWHYHTNPQHLENCRQNSSHMPKNYSRSGQGIKKGSKKRLKVKWLLCRKGLKKNRAPAWNVQYGRGL